MPIAEKNIRTSFFSHPSLYLLSLNQQKPSLSLPCRCRRTATATATGEHCRPTSDATTASYSSLPSISPSSLAASRPPVNVQQANTGSRSALPSPAKSADYRLLQPTSSIELRMPPLPLNPTSPSVAPFPLQPSLDRRDPDNDSRPARPSRRRICHRRLIFFGK
ncbi:hypothetical protein FXO38_09338 [Capsicum annuum]|nr:hypothetical protein FXO37_33307 [Capsicum annuum]KAF3665862.1 hypothetical protein FXO38_09338 [Capsicum annuum]